MPTAFKRISTYPAVLFTVALLTVVLSACEQTLAPVGVVDEIGGARFYADGSVDLAGLHLTADGDVRGSSLSGAGNGAFGLAVGHGVYRLADVLDIDLALVALQRGDRALGFFSQTVEFDGLRVEFDGEVTCLAVDAENGRAWIGGVVLHNHSTDPDFQGAIHQPGRDVWFRVLDGAPDRSTFLGFEGGGGIITSQEYCDARIWPDGDARTHPVTRGNILVKAH